MNILVIGGVSHFTNQMIIKLKKEGHRVSLLTGSYYQKTKYEKVFERYDFSYDSDNLKEIFEAVNPDITICMGAWDSNYKWQEEEREAVKFTSGLMNLLVSYSMVSKGRFVYLSSADVFLENEREEDIQEETLPDAMDIRAMAISQGERMCESYRTSRNLDIVILRIDQIYYEPKNMEQVDNPCAKMCLKALQTGTLTVNPNAIHSMIHLSDAIAFIYKTIMDKRLNFSIYHITTAKEFSDLKMAKWIKQSVSEKVMVTELEGAKRRRVLSNRGITCEFEAIQKNNLEATIERIISYMEKHKDIFLDKMDEKLPWWKKLYHKFEWLIQILIPFVENMICFIPFFMLNNRAVGNVYFQQLDFYLLYVLLFAILYGQNQAIFSAVLAMAGYLFRQMYDKSGFEVMLDYNTYIWIAQLFIVGLAVGYMRDQIRAMKRENEQMEEFLKQQVQDMKDIHSSNVRVKDVLEKQVIDQKDSIGKIYNITSTLDQYSPDEVIFYAAEILSKVLNSRDVAIYMVHNETYARMFSATSKKARSLGNSIKYRELGPLYDQLHFRKVYINRKLEKNLPMMANAIYEKDDMKLIVMIWDVPWERMTLAQANMLVVTGYLIQNALLRANRYIAALEEERYRHDTKILEVEAFTSLVNAYRMADEKNLAECCLVRILVKPKDCEKAAVQIGTLLRQTDYMGIMEDNKLYVLLANTTGKEAVMVLERFKCAGVESTIVEG